MKTKILLCAFAFVVAYSSTAQEQSNETKTDTAKPKTAIVKIEEGSLLKVKSLSEISSKTASEGDLLDFTVFENVVVNGKLF
jgi:hypothetical protein